MTTAWAPYALPFLPWAGSGRNVTLVLTRPLVLMVTEDQETLVHVNLTARQAREIAEQLLHLAQMEDGTA